VGAESGEIVLTTNTTEGMSFVANGLDLSEGDEVLTTRHEHGGGLCGWEILRDRRNITLTRLALPSPAESAEGIVSIFEDAITPQTKVMSFCHINYTTGLRMPVKELCQLARDHEIISVVDGAHAIGMLNLDLHDLGCDFYACSPHKWLNAPPGTGVLYVRLDARDLLWPTVTESYGDFFKDDLCSMMQLRGQQCTPAFACLNDIISFQNTMGKDRIQGRILALSGYLKGKIAAAWGEDKIFSPTDEELSSGLTSFNPFDDVFDGGKVGDVSTTLRDEYHIVIRTTSFRDKESDRKDTRALRVSTHIFNNYKQIDELVSAIQSIMAGM
jgi:selenocysteine lyase/cysteine desulfurase